MQRRLISACNGHSLAPDPVPRLLGQASLKSGLLLAIWPLDLGYSKLAFHLYVSVSQGNISEILHFKFHPWVILSVLTLDKNTFNLLKMSQALGFTYIDSFVVL